ncbi:MAG: transglutaminase family protein [Pseudomonadales bacterium]
MKKDLNKYLQASDFINSDAASIIECAKAHTNPDNSDTDNAIALYYFVRDSVRYNPYTATISRDTLTATSALEAGEAWCVPKAVLMAALCRAAGIPSRVGFADVRNHLSTAKMRASMNSDIFYFHGYCSNYLNGKWVKSTPAFNLSLCEKFNLKPLEFDGVNDSLYHEFDNNGNRHMEYVSERGEYLDIPYDDLMEVFNEHYPDVIAGSAKTQLNSADWEADVDEETGG